MGNKNAIPPQAPATGTAQGEEEACIDGASGSVSRDGAPGPELLASLQSLRDNRDDSLLPHSLHQIGPTPSWGVSNGPEELVGVKRCSR
ncbi:hypothetical protein EYF80_067542 [Liparis tanakae]|uniref:Uncharacterized protein n=1 Tax=Liparis tanakae TaxID=230148 RepID=A0A4Z2E0S6_9TELE|nr:hypothetical protein EYF80_067542 [Liparis tanakae]